MSGDSLETLGQQAYQKQIWGDYEEAINLYTTAINKFQNDRRILNNRCCCYIECGDYKRALQDAETMINLFPDYNKSYYRKGEILKGLKHYKEAEQAFHKVLSLDKNCEDARQQLLEVQILQLLALPGCTRAKALQAISLTNNITDAERFIRFGSSDTNQLYEDGIFVSDDEDIDAPKAASEYEPLMDPTNPVHSTSLWIGCITETTTEEMLRDLFSNHWEPIMLVAESYRGYKFTHYEGMNGSKPPPSEVLYAPHVGYHSFKWSDMNNENRTLPTCDVTAGRDRISHVN
uniref:Uncharacterized protein n=1 Tax=Timema shepardi TaxID=629360 RepID=A0A7R9ASJ4_TIMSH|nr:unnamed protein product [Timema shepardi]